MTEIKPKRKRSDGSVTPDSIACDLILSSKYLENIPCDKDERIVLRRLITTLQKLSEKITRGTGCAIENFIDENYVEPY
jgi:hypothetical protein